MTIGVYGAYRSVANQAWLFVKTARTKGLRFARKMVAFPEKSEHHTGLALDIVPFENGRWVIDYETLFSMSKYYARVHERLARHGFILRYPKGKEKVTGYPYEPWHITYVGIPEAEYITEKGITLEEYRAEGKK